MTSPTLLAYLLQIGRDCTEPLRVLVVYDGPDARKRAKQMLKRIGGRLGAGLRIACVYQRIDVMRHRDMKAGAPQIELVFLAVSCCAMLPQEHLSEVISLLPLLTFKHGALAFLSGTIAPRQLDIIRVEQFLFTHSKRAGVAFFSGCMPGLGCPGCGATKREKSGQSGVEEFCVLHAPGKLGGAIGLGLSHPQKPTKMKKPPSRSTKAGHPVPVGARRQIRREYLE